MNKKTILYIPDYESLNAPEVTKAFKEAFPEWKVACLEIDINSFADTEKNLGKYMHLYHPDVLISEGLGAFFIHRCAGKNRICVNADMHPSYRCKEALVEMYTEKEKVQLAFDRDCDRAKNTHCWGVFGKDAERREFYMVHYPNIINVPRKVSSILDALDECTSLIKTISDSEWTDEYGVTYAEYGRVIVKADYALFRDVEDYTIPHGVRTIMNGAFYGMDLKSVTIPDSVTYMGHHVFSECKLLEEVALPPKMEKIEMRSFMNCISLKEVKLPWALRTIETEAFKATAIRSIEVPPCLTRMDHNVFDDGVKLIIKEAELRELLDDSWHYHLKFDDE
jgi:hypothetical protein